MIYLNVLCFESEEARLTVLSDAKLSFPLALAPLLWMHCTKKMYNALNLTVQSTTMHAAIENANCN